MAPHRVSVLRALHQPEAVALEAVDVVEAGHLAQRARLQQVTAEQLWAQRASDRSLPASAPAVPIAPAKARVGRKAAAPVDPPGGGRRAGRSSRARAAGGGARPAAGRARRRRDGPRRARAASARPPGASGPREDQPGDQEVGVRVAGVLRTRAGLRRRGQVVARRRRAPRMADEPVKRRWRDPACRRCGRAGRAPWPPDRRATRNTSAGPGSSSESRPCSASFSASAAVATLVTLSSEKSSARSSAWPDAGPRVPRRLSTHGRPGRSPPRWRPGRPCPSPVRAEVRLELARDRRRQPRARRRVGGPLGGLRGCGGAAPAPSDGQHRQTGERGGPTR